MSIESRNIITDLEIFSDGFKVGDKNLGTIVEKLAPIVDEAYSVMAKYLENNSLENNDVSNKKITSNETNILSSEENI